MANRTALRSIQRTNLREEVITVLRAAIVGGELAPGSIHSATSLADRLGVSATPVREAMRALAASGLVEVLPNRGFRVTMMDEQDLDEIAALRLMLEVPAVALVVERASDSELDRLATWLGELEAAAAASDPAAFLIAERAFHLELLALAGNRRLMRMVADLRDQTRITGLPSAMLEVAAAEHRPIFEAIRARDVATAQHRMRAHLEALRLRMRLRHRGEAP